MRIKYFEDTDTALFEFRDEKISEMKEISENSYADLDREGNLVSMTVEHAGKRANILDFAFQRVKQSA